MKKKITIFSKSCIFFAIVFGTGADIIFPNLGTKATMYFLWLPFFIGIFGLLVVLAINERNEDNN